MTKEEIIEKLNIEDGTIFLEPCDVYNKGIVGCTEDRCHLIYDYEELMASLADDYRNEWENREHSEGEDEPDFYTDAIEWLDYNTMRSLPYMDDEFRPIIMFQLKDN